MDVSTASEIYAPTFWANDCMWVVVKPGAKAKGGQWFWAVQGGFESPAPIHMVFREDE